jgi:hypothetical protein
VPAATEPVDPAHDYRDRDEVLRALERKLDELLAQKAPAGAQPTEVEGDPWIYGRRRG